MFSFDLVRPPSTEVVLVYGLAAGGTEAKWAILEPGEEVPQAVTVQLTGHRAAAQYENPGNCKRGIIASQWDGCKESSLPKLQLASRLAGEGRRKKCFPATLKSQEIYSVKKWL